MNDFADDNCLSDEDKLLGSSKGDCSDSSQLDSLLDSTLSENGSESDCSDPSQLDSVLETTLIQSSIGLKEADAIVNDIQENLRDFWIGNLSPRHKDLNSTLTLGNCYLNAITANSSANGTDNSSPSSDSTDINLVLPLACAATTLSTPEALVDAHSAATVQVTGIAGHVLSNNSVNDSQPGPTIVNSGVSTTVDGKRPLQDTVIVPIAKRRKVIMTSSDEESVNKPDLHLVLVAPVDDECILSVRQGEKIAGKVAVALKAEENPEVKFEFSGPDRGRYKFVCPNEAAKNWAMNILPKLEGLFDKPKLKVIDQGIIPKLVKASCIFYKKAPNFVDFCEELERKNENLDTLHWRPYKNKKLNQDKTIVFFGIDAASATALKNIGFRPYYETGRSKVTVEYKK